MLVKSGARAPTESQHEAAASRAARPAPLATSGPARTHTSTSTSTSTATGTGTSAGAVRQLALQAMAAGSVRQQTAQPLQAAIATSARQQALVALQAKADTHAPGRAAGAAEAAPAHGGRGLPGALKAGVEALSGIAMDQVQVHYNSARPAQLQAHAFAQGSQIHLGPGQEHQLPHEAWHVVQQAQARVRPTAQFAGAAINADPALEQEADLMGARSLDAGRRGGAGVPAPARMAGATPVIQGAFTYTASVIIDRAGAAKENASDVAIKSIKLPERMRPPTQYGIKQQAHSVSWTLLVKSYEAFQDNKIGKFIDDYLKPDWSALRKQAEMGKIPAAEKLFDAYLAKYDDGYWTTLKATPESLLRWHGLMQKCVTDYFVALQLAPLSTHTGYLQSADPSMGINEAKPSGHGEGAANTFFAALEQGGGSGKSEDEVRTHASAYWDTGTGRAHGISEPEQVELVVEEFETAFARSYPKTWAQQESIIKKIGAATRVQAALASTSGVASGKKPKAKAAADGDEEVDEDAGGFQAQVELATQSGGAASADKYIVTDYKVTEIALPDDRPMTKYGVIGQKSHTVSWTLVLNALDSLGRNKSLKSFQQALLLKWLDLRSQDWDGMLARDLISSGDFKVSKSGDQLAGYNAKNRERLTGLKNKIATNIGGLAQAIAGRTFADAEWARFSQTALADYVLVYQSAPLTAFKGEKNPAGHGEPDANFHLGWIEGDLSGNLGKWQLLNKASKFRNDLFDKPSYPPAKSHWKGHDKDERERPGPTSALAIAKVVHKPLEGANKAITKSKASLRKGLDGLVEGSAEHTKQLQAHDAALASLESDFELALEDKLGKEQRAEMDKHLVKNLALKYLDVRWSAVGDGALISLDYSPKYYAKILVEWEDAMRDAYPQIWSNYGKVFRAYSDGVALSDGLAASGTETRIASWTMAERRERDYRRGQVAIQAGDETMEAEDGQYNTAKTDYMKGRFDARADPAAVAASTSGAYVLGFEEYRHGRNDARALVPVGLDPGRNLAYQVAYQDYLAGIGCGKRSATPEPGQHQGEADYRAGVQKARQLFLLAALNRGEREGMADYGAGIVHGQNGTPWLYGGERDARDDYLHGILAAKTRLMTTTSGAFGGYDEYNAGFQAGFAGVPAASPHHAYAEGYSDGLRNAKKATHSTAYVVHDPDAGERDGKKQRTIL
jgi:hypothetical protein